MGKDSGSGTVLITGASSGIGLAAARVFAGAGFRVFATSRRERPSGHGVHMLRLDVRSDQSVARCVADVLSLTGRIDVLVNNAGVMYHGIAEETPIPQAQSLFETNLFGVVRVTNAVLPGMREQRQGRIINVGSLARWVAEPGEAFYSASKHALAGYTEALRHEVWPFGIHVSLLEPVAFDTDILARASTVEGAIEEYRPVSVAARRTFEESMRGAGDPARAGRRLLKIARTRSPRLRYGVGGDAHWLPYLKVLLPQRLFDRLLRRAFHLSNPGVVPRRR